MKRLVWGAVLSLCAAASTGSHLRACDKQALFVTPESTQQTYEVDGNTVLVISDDEFVTVVVYPNSNASDAKVVSATRRMHSEWM